MAEVCRIDAALFFGSAKTVQQLSKMILDNYLYSFDEKEAVRIVTKGGPLYLRDKFGPYALVFSKCSDGSIEFLHIDGI
jgi:hypothetical protein